MAFSDWSIKSIMPISALLIRCRRALTFHPKLSLWLTRQLTNFVFAKSCENSQVEAAVLKHLDWETRWRNTPPQEYRLWTESCSTEPELREGASRFCQVAPPLSTLTSLDVPNRDLTTSSCSPKSVFPRVRYQTGNILAPGVFLGCWVFTGHKTKLCGKYMDIWYICRCAYIFICIYIFSDVYI